MTELTESTELTIEQKHAEIEKHMGLVPFIIKKHFGTAWMNVELRDELISIGYLSMSRSIHKWKPEQSKFNTFSYQKIVWDMVSYLTGRKKPGTVTVKTVPLKSAEHVPQKQDDNTATHEMRELLPKLMEVLPPKQREAVELRMRGVSPADAAKMLCTRRQTFNKHMSYVYQTGRKIFNV